MEIRPNFREIENAKIELHNLLRRVVVSTKLGRQHKKPDDDIELDIGGGYLCSCRKYGQVRYFPGEALKEYELDYNLSALTYLLKEVNKRFQKFRKARDSNKNEYIKGKKKFAQRYFDSALVDIEKEFN